MIKIEVDGNNAVVSTTGEKEITMSELIIATVSAFYVITKNSGIKEKKSLMRKLLSYVKKGIVKGNEILINE